MAKKKEDLQASAPVITLAEPDRTGEPIGPKGLGESTKAGASPVQQDFIPGSRQASEDPLYVPKFIEVKGERRRVYNPDEYVLYWSGQESGDIAFWKSKHYDFFPYDPIFTDSGLYERSIHGRVYNGDLVLMFAPIRAWQAFVDEVSKRKDLYENAPRTSFANEGYRHGIRTFREYEGGRIEYD